MNRELKKMTLVVVGLWAMTTVMSVQARTVVDETRPIAADGRVQIDNVAGSIEVSAWDRQEVSIKGELGDRVEKLEISETSGGLRVRVHHESNQRRVDESDLVLRVPAGVSIEAESISADISLRGLDNSSIVVSTVSGDIEIQASTDQLEVETVSGDVEFAGASPRSSIETVSGEIEAQGVEGEVRVSTVSGDLVLKAGAVSLGRFETVSGDLELDLQVLEAGRVSADSMSGDVLLVLPGEQQAEFTAETYSGEIRTDFGSVDKDSSRHGRSLNHREGNNDASIQIESFSGDARLKKR